MLGLVLHSGNIAMNKKTKILALIILILQWRQEAEIDINKISKICDMLDNNNKSYGKKLGRDRELF